MVEQNVVEKIVLDQDDNALYFSRAAIPYSRDESTDRLALESAMRHHGIYAYRVSTLRRLMAAGPSPAERCEKLEQLRALWLGINIRVGRASQRPGRGVDTEEDLTVVEAALAAIGDQ